MGGFLPVRFGVAAVKRGHPPQGVPWRGCPAALDTRQPGADIPPRVSSTVSDAPAIGHFTKVTSHLPSTVMK